MLKTLLSAILSLIASTAFAESGQLTLIKHRPVYAFIQETEKARFECWRVSRSYWDAFALASYGQGSTEQSMLDTHACVGKQRDIPKPSLITALKYLESKPGSAKALKECKRPATPS